MNTILAACPALFIVAIRVNPLPKGTRDFEWEKVRDQFVAGEKLAIFGALKNQKSK